MKRFFAALILCAGLLHAEPRTFTDQFGRTITAELISVDGDQVRIRRDDGQIFTLAASKLTEDDQKFIQNWAATQSKTAASAPASADKSDEKFIPDPKKIVVTLSRGKFDSRTIAKYENYSHKHEQWGYSIQLTNQHLRAVPKLRIEYNLFARTYADTSSPTLITGSKTIDTIPSRGSEVFRTGTAEVCKHRDTYYGNNYSGEMRGIWIRIYVDGQLLIEQASPDSLMQSEKWTNVRGE
ncbi:MAG TPA: hypothetical protein VIM44_04495 [Rariglobus sp.]